MSRLTDVLFARRDAGSSTRMVGMPATGGLVGGVTATTALGLSAVWRCLDILSNGVSQLEWREVRGTLDLPLSRLVTRPSSFYTRREWVSLVVSTLALYDVVYLLRLGGEDSEGVPLGLLPIPPGLVQPKTQDSFNLFPPTHFYLGNQSLTSDQFVILRRSPQPGISDALGGVINLARATFAEAIAAETYASRYWQAGGPTTRALETDQAMPLTTAQLLADTWAERRAKGPDYVPVLTNGLHFKEYGVDPTSESAVMARRELVADLARYFGVPTRIVNAPTGDSETYSSSESANLDLVRFTLQNYIGAIEDGISDLLPGGRRMRMRTAALTFGPTLARAQAFQLATGSKAWMTPDDVREELGMPPVENPDDLNPPAPAPVVVAQSSGGNANG